MTGLVRLDGERDAQAVLDVFRRAADYVLLETGAGPGMENVQAFFADAPPGQMPDDVLKLGLLDPGGDLAGVADLAFGYPSLGDAYIGLLLITQSSRGRGLGKEVLDRLEGIARARGARRLLIAVIEGNAAGIRFWERNGFTCDERVAALASEGSARLRYVKGLGQRRPLIRDYRPEDLDDVIEIFIRAIRERASKDYTPAQVDAWARADRQIWSERRLSRPTWVAELDREVVGFTDCEPDGHIDMLYVHPRSTGKGVARTLLQRAEDHALANGIMRLHSEVSLTARPVFEKGGFTVIEEERVYRNGQHFNRFKMAKSLKPARSEQDTP